MAQDWVGQGGRMTVLRQAKVTGECYLVSTVVCVQERGMKEPWCIVGSDWRLPGSEIKKYYGKRFTCEETFRDVKDLHYGMGMSWQPIGRPERRDRMMMVAVIGMALLTIPWKRALISLYSKKQWDPRSGDKKYRRSLTAIILYSAF